MTSGRITASFRFHQNCQRVLGGEHRLVAGDLDRLRVGQLAHGEVIGEHHQVSAVAADREVTGFRPGVHVDAGRAVERLAAAGAGGQRSAPRRPDHLREAGHQSSHHATTGSEIRARNTSRSSITFG
jgi:hypothetical protein